MTRIQRDFLANLFIIAFCGVMYTWAIPTYTPPYPGFGASPALVGNSAVGLMFVMSCLSLVRLFLAQFGEKPLPKDEAEFPEEAAGFTQIGHVNLLHLAIFMVPCFLFVIAIQYVAYLVAAFVFLMVLQYAMGNRNWVQMVAIAVVMDALMYVIMRYGFGVPVPGPQLVFF